MGTKCKKASMGDCVPLNLKRSRRSRPIRGFSSKVNLCFVVLPAIGTQVADGSLPKAIRRALDTHADTAEGSSEKSTGSESRDEGSLPPGKGEVHLKRRVGLVSGVALIVGTMIGTFRRLRESLSNQLNKVEE